MDSSIILKGIMILIMTLSGSMGAFFLKKGMNKIQIITLIGLLKIPELYVGGALYVVGAVSNIFLLRIMPYTVVYPITSLTYVWTMVISALFLKERITVNKVVAVGFIVSGICCITL